jgi:hypothetical protein
MAKFRITRYDLHTDKFTVVSRQTGAAELPAEYIQLSDFDYAPEEPSDIVGESVDLSAEALSYIYGIG